MELENTTTHWLPPNYPECPENDHQDVKLLDSFGFWMEGVAQTSIAIGMDWVYVQRRASERVAYNSRLRLYSMEKKSTKVEFPPYRVKKSIVHSKSNLLNSRCVFFNKEFNSKKIYFHVEITIGGLYLVLLALEIPSLTLLNLRLTCS